MHEHDGGAHDGQDHQRAVEVEQLAEALGDGIPSARSDAVGGRLEQRRRGHERCGGVAVVASAEARREATQVEGLAAQGPAFVGGLVALVGLDVKDEVEE